MVWINDKKFKMTSILPNSAGRMFSLLLVLGLMLTIVHPVLAQDTPAEVGVFDPIEVAPGEVVQVPISIRNVLDLYGVDLTIEFDPALVQVEDIIIRNGFAGAHPVDAGRAVNQGVITLPGMQFLQGHKLAWQGG